MAQLARRRVWRPKHAPQGGAGGFHLPQAPGRVNYVGSAEAPVGPVVLPLPPERVTESRASKLFRAILRKAA